MTPASEPARLAPRRAAGRPRRPRTDLGQEVCAYRRAYPDLTWRQIGLLFELTAEQARDVWRHEGGGPWWTGRHDAESRTVAGRGGRRRDPGPCQPGGGR